MNGDLGWACTRGRPALDDVAPRPVGSPPAPRRAPAAGGGCRRLRARRRGRGGSGEGRGEGGFLPPHTQSRSRIYRVSRSGAERREQFPSGWSTSRSLGEGPGFRAALVEPHPEPEKQVLQGPQPSRSEPAPRKAECGLGWPRRAGLAGVAGGAGPLGARGRVGVRPGGSREAFAEHLQVGGAPAAPRGQLAVWARGAPAEPAKVARAEAGTAACGPGPQGLTSGTAPGQ